MEGEGGDDAVAVIQVAVPSPLRSHFDYLPPLEQPLDGIKPGMRVLVPFGNRELVGVIAGKAVASAKILHKLRRAILVLDQEPLFSESVLALINWTSNYYHHPIGEVFSHALPRLLRQKNYSSRKAVEVDCSRSESSATLDPEAALILNAEQQAAILAIQQQLGDFQTFLLDGVTGSGKTEIYLQVIESVVERGQQALVLIPEINLTPQTIARFTRRFKVKIAIFHSRLTLKERLTSWLAAKSGEAAIVIGTRSAVFVTLRSPGIIVVDEEHDLSFKQQSGLRYSARDLAVVRGKLEKIPVVLGSATPSVESIYNVQSQRYLRLNLPQRVGRSIYPQFHLVDLRKQKLSGGVAKELIPVMKQHLERDGQILIFLNRRGFAPILICPNCGWIANCPYCDAHLILHHKKQQLGCHHCGEIDPIPTNCPKCGHEKLLSLGIGTERVELELRELFPEVPMVRVDRDTTQAKGALEERLGGIHEGEFQILIGTQMLAKGHHFPKVTMVVVVNVDHSLASFDFRASEHLAQLVIQVAGRAGRAEQPGEVYLQSYNPGHPLLQRLVQDDYGSLVERFLTERKQTKLPPFSYLALLQTECKTQQLGISFLKEVKAQLEPNLGVMVKVFGPVPNVMERKAGWFRAQLLFQAAQRPFLHQTIDQILAILKIKKSRGLRWFLDIDPVELG